MQREVAELLMEVVPRLMRLIATEAQSSDAAATLTPTQLRVLWELERGCHLSSELARELRITPASASEVVDLLVRRGLVERGNNPEDRRLIPLAVTPSGSACLASAMSRALYSLQQLMEGVDESDLPALSRAMDLLNRRIQEGRSQPAGSGRAD